ncbi:MAG: GntR family transcriptional regulator [Bacteroidales bacterium]|nr:GntR family transcriptional regulator [Bacteroidales bacterium]
MDDIFQNIGNKLTLSQRIERTLESEIREKKLVVGSKLPTEREMCESFGVSRTALREALRRLSARGLITIQKGSGMYVSEINIEDAIKTLDLYYDLKLQSLLPLTGPKRTWMNLPGTWLSLNSAILTIPNWRLIWITGST